MSHGRVNKTKAFSLLWNLVCSFEMGREPRIKFDLFCTGKLKTIEFPLFSSVKPIDQKGIEVKGYETHIFLPSVTVFSISCYLQIIAFSTVTFE